MAGVIGVPIGLDRGHRRLGDRQRDAVRLDVGLRGEQRVLAQGRRRLVEAPDEVLQRCRLLGVGQGGVARRQVAERLEVARAGGEHPDLARRQVERGERLGDDGGGDLAVGHRGGGTGDRQVAEVDGAVGDVVLGEVLHQEVLLDRALLDGDRLALQLRCGLDGRVGRHHDVVRRDLGVRSLRRRHDLHRIAGRLGEDRRRLGHVAEVDRPTRLRRDDRRAADEVGPVHLVRRPLEGVGGERRWSGTPSAGRRR